MRNIAEHVLKTIEKYSMVHRGETIVCGLSGGPDSVCMLHILHRLKDYLGVTPVAVHIHHGIRGKEAEEDMLFSEKFAKELGVEFITRAFNVPELAKQLKISEEEAGRRLRYDTFREIGKKKAPYKIAVAHNANDVAETFLFNLARGAGLEGLCSIKRVNEDIIRPLLDVYKDEIMEYLDQNRLGYRIDSTNHECDYTRNKIRNRLIPEMNRVLNTDIVYKILQTTDVLEDDLVWLKESGKKAYEACTTVIDGQKEIDCTLFNEYPLALQRQMIRLYLHECTGSLDGYGSYHVNRLIELTKSESPISTELPNKYWAIYRYGRLYIGKNQIQKDTYFTEISLSIPGETESANWKICSEILEADHKTDYRKMAGKYVQFFDFEKTGPCLKVRYRKDGDVFKPIGLNGTKKLKDYFIDNKIEREKRAKIPLIEGPEGILWVVGCGRSDLAKVTDQTEKVLKLSFQETKGETTDAI
jgi:tRNA(Ile)-lysidine synthase